MTGEAIAAPSSPRDGEDVSNTPGRSKVCQWFSAFHHSSHEFSSPDFPNGLGNTVHNVSTIFHGCNNLLWFSLFLFLLFKDHYYVWEQRGQSERRR